MKTNKIRPVLLIVLIAAIGFTVIVCLLPFLFESDQYLPPLAEPPDLAPIMNVELVNPEELPAIREGYTVPEHHLTTLYDSALDVTYLLYDGKLLEEQLEGENYNDKSNDKGSVILIRSIAEEYGDNLPFKLYCLKNGVITLVADNVSDTWLSGTGDFALVLRENTLYRYELPDGEITKIHSGINSFFVAQISPDEQTMIYYVDILSEDETYINWDNQDAYYYRDGNVIVLDDEKPQYISVLNDGSYYYIDYNFEKLCFKTSPNGDEKKIITGQIIEDVTNNRDGTQHIISVYGYDEVAEFYFMLLENDGVIKVSKINNNDMNSRWLAMIRNRLWNNYDYYSYFDLREKWYSSVDGSVWFFTKSLEMKYIASDVDHYIKMISDDGKTLVYEVAGNIFRTYAANLNNVNSIEAAVERVEITSDGGYVYYLTDDYELYCYDWEKEPVKIDDEVIFIVVSHDNTLFYLKDNVQSYYCLLYSYNTIEGIELIAEGVYMQNFLQNYNWYTAIEDGKRNVYLGISGAKFSRVIEDFNSR